MKKKLLIFLVLIASLIGSNFYAQVSCGTPSTSTPQHFSDENENLFRNNNPICINIQFHIVKQNNGSGGVSEIFVEQVLNILNSHFNPQNIYIKKVGISTINNSNFYDMNDGRFNSLTSTNNNPNAINFYIVNSCSDWSGRAGDITSRNLVIVSSIALTGVSSHELGHCLNLWHTFQGTRSGTSGCAEAINGSNCSSCGDYVCDTPADQGYGAINGYNPDMTNNMSYYSPFTLDHFTNLQGVRMRNALQNSPILQAIKSNNCLDISGENIICGNTNITYNVANPTNLNINWGVSSNLTKISETNSSITVVSNGNGYASITANFANGLVSNKNIWIGIPYITNTVERPSHCQFQFRAKDYYPLENSNTIFSWSYVSGTGNASASGFSTSGDFANVYVCPPFAFRLKITANNSCGTIEQYVDLWLNNDEEEIYRYENKQIFTVSPNPTSDLVSISLDKNINALPEVNKIQAEVYNNMGQRVRILNVNNGKAIISLGVLPQGIYTLKIIYNNQIESHQIIKK